MNAEEWMYRLLLTLCITLAGECMCQLRMVILPTENTVEYVSVTFHLVELLFQLQVDFKGSHISSRL